jgi:uncharacterized cupin superfamily protein
MADVIVKSFDELDSSYQGAFMHAAKSLGVTAWGMNIERLPPGWADYPLHDHAADGQEEVYLVLEGSVTLEADDDRWTLNPGSLARVGPEQMRKITPGDEGATVLVLGGTPGKAFEPKA